MKPVINVKRLPHGQNLPLPRRMTPGSSGCDIAAAVETPLELKPGERAIVPTGLIFAIPEGYEVQIRPRSGLAAKYGITVLNTPGTIDADYRGEVKIILINLGSVPFTINRGERIAQAVPASVASNCDFVEKAEVSETERGSGGFGHTGVI
jgi:dUTP pyrophosphatase